MKQKGHISCDGVLLPKYLFYQNSSKLKSVSPHANFDPVSAASQGVAFQGSTSPSHESEKKVIIIDKSSLVNMDMGEFIGLIERLRIAGFKIYSCTSDAENRFQEIRHDLSGNALFKMLSSMSEFSPEDDYVKLAESFSFARDRLVVLNQLDLYEVEDCFTRDVSCDMSYIVSDNMGLYVLPDLSDSIGLEDKKKHFDRLKFFLKFSSPEEEKAFISYYRSKFLELLGEKVMAAYSKINDKRGPAQNFVQFFCNITQALIDAAGKGSDIDDDFNWLIYNYVKLNLQLNQDASDLILQALDKVVDKTSLQRLGQNIISKFTVLLQPRCLGDFVKKIGALELSLGGYTEAMRESMKKQALIHLLLSRQDEAGFLDNFISAYRSKIDVEFIASQRDSLSDEAIKKLLQVVECNIDSLLSRSLVRDDCRYSPKVRSNKKITYVYLSGLDAPERADDINLSMVSALNVGEIERELKDWGARSIMEKIKERFPKLKYINLPNILMERCGEWIDLFLPHTGIKIMPDPKPFILVRTGIAGRSSEKSIFIAQNDLSASITPAEGEESRFRMVSAGEVLSGCATSPKVRTGIIECNYAESFDQKYYYPESFINCEAVEIEGVDQYRVRDDENIYCKFTQYITAGKEFRLLSIGANEELEGFVGSVEGLVLRRGDDGFYYVKSLRDCDLTYVIRSPKQKLALEDLKAVSLEVQEKRVLDIISTHKLNRLKYEAAGKGVAMPDLSLFPNNDEWLHAVYQSGAGACRHLVAALANEFSRNGIDPRSYRAMSINNNHVCMEVFCGGRWFEVDLGGSRAIEMRSVDIYRPAAVKKPQDAVAAVSFDDLYLFLDKEDISPSLMFKPSRPSFNIIKKYNIAKPKEIVDVRELLAVLGSNGAVAGSAQVDVVTKKSIIVTNEIEPHANFLIKRARELGRPTFYLDSPSQINFDRQAVIIDHDGKPLFGKSIFECFLDGCRANPTDEPLLIINWSAFDARQRLTLNTILDEQRTVAGKEISPNVQIIGLSNQAISDPSFLSRHEGCFKSSLKLDVTEFSINPTETVEVDLCDFPNWRKKLFGPVILSGKEMIWQPSEFVDALKSGKSNFTIINLSQEAATELRYEINKAKALGCFEYNGHVIALPEDLKINLQSNNFDFSRFDKGYYKITANVTYDDRLKETNLINTYLFDALLQGYRIEDGFYIEEGGLIFQAANTSDKILKLFITSNLSQNQWYCLFREAQKHEVKLDISIASNVLLPPEIVPNSIATEAKDSDVLARPKIYITNNSNKKTAEILQAKSRDRFANPIYGIIDVEDFSYQDLFGKVTFDKTATGFENFEKSISKLLSKLEKGREVIVRGKFSPDLLKMLEPLMARKDEFEEIGANLTIIIEDESVASTDAFYEPLAWLRRQDCEIDISATTEVVIAKKYFEDDPDFNLHPSESKEEAIRFAQKRESNFISMLKDNPMLQLVGHSGVGKSRLMRKFAHNAKYRDLYEVHHELHSFEAWAKSESDKTKILFIDESNLQDQHLTLFSQLKAGGNRKIFYQGKFYNLSKNHKVVFARNPIEYGGGRVVQKLFADDSIPEMHLKDFPANYLYEQMLKKAIYNKLGTEIIAEEKFKISCARLIEEYYKANSEKPESQTIRELQERVLMMLLNKAEEAKMPHIISDSFTSTRATKEAEESFRDFLDIRQKQKEGLFPLKSLGLNGIFFKGDSGVGKSQMIKSILENCDFYIQNGLSLLEDLDASLTSAADSAADIVGRKICYKIDASQTLQQKRSIIIEAFKQGHMIWIDELNSCLDDGLEKVLNSVLTGFHPDTGERSLNPGFTLVASANEISLEGRSLISPALLHRMVCPKVTKLQDYSVEDLSAIISNWGEDKKLAPDFAEEIARDTYSLLKTNEGRNLNLRILKQNIGAIAKDYSIAARDRFEALSKDTTEGAQYLL